MMQGIVDPSTLLAGMWTAASALGSSALILPIKSTPRIHPKENGKRASAPKLARMCIAALLIVAKWCVNSLYVHQLMKGGISCGEDIHNVRLFSNKRNEVLIHATTSMNWKYSKWNNLVRKATYCNGVIHRKWLQMGMGFLLRVIKVF